MSPKRLDILGWIVVIVVAAFLRLNNLTDRPVHADEATGARILATSLEGEGYTFSPTHFHGPLLTLSAVPIARLLGETNWSELSTLTLRLSSVSAGMLLILSPLLWRRQIGAPCALAGAAFMATSPLLVYYSRMYIHETLLATMGMFTFYGLYSLLMKPSMVKGVFTGACLGLMFATKETFIISVISALPTIGILWLNNSLDKTPSVYIKPLALLALSAVFVACFFYSQGFTQLTGVYHALQTFFVYETTPGHDKPFGYYLHFLIWPKQAIGMWWSEAGILILATMSVLVVVCKRTVAHSASVFLGICIICHLLIYSLIAYKTPWLMLLPWTLCCLMAGVVVTRWSELPVNLRVTLATFIFLTISYQTWQSTLASGKFSSDARIPYAYVPTSKDAPKIERWLDQLAENSGTSRLQPIAVVGPGYWPLPWYLRKFNEIGYWSEPVPALVDLPVVFALPQQTEACSELLNVTHIALPRGLRSNVSVTMYLRADIWKQWNDQSNK